MYLNNITARALRQGVLENADGDKTTDNSSKIAESAKKFAKQQIDATSDSSNLKINTSLQEAAITIGILALKTGYEALQSTLNNLRNARDNFSDECTAPIATFIMPNQTHKLSKEQRFIHNFLKRINNSSFSKAIGMSRSSIENQKNHQLYALLPHYSMSYKLEQTVISRIPIDMARYAIDLFLLVSLPRDLNHIENIFYNQSKVAEVPKSWFQRENYLNNLRAPRFVIMSLGNLLWNLQHPIDPLTHYPLSIQNCIQLCLEVRAFLNQLLDETSECSIFVLCERKSKLASFLRQVEVYTQNLRNAYTYELMRDPNIYQELVNACHVTLRTLNNSVLKLIFVREDPITKITYHDPEAASRLSQKISYLNQLVSKTPTIVNHFATFSTSLKSKQTLINTPITTVVDILILFCHLQPLERATLCNNLKHDKTDDSLELRSLLKSLAKEFIKPVEAYCEIELKKGSTRDVTNLSARLLIALMALVITDYRVIVDSITTYKQAQYSQSPDSPNSLLSGEEQIEAINDNAKQGDTSYYLWKLSPFLKLSDNTEKELNQLLLSQYRLSEVTKLLDRVQDILDHYQNFLQLPAFRTFLKLLCENVKNEFDCLQEQLVKIEKLLSQDTLMTRPMNSLFNPISQQLTTSLTRQGIAISNLTNAITPIPLRGQELEDIKRKIGKIDTQYKKLFKEDSGLNPLTKTTFFGNADNSISTILANTHHQPFRQKTSKTKDIQRIVALHTLITNCHDALSYQSKTSQKGRLLQQLMMKVRQKPPIREEDLKNIILELTRICASYRPTYFFQAAYGHTRSCNVLIAAIKNTELNELLPLASALFDDDTIQVKTLTLTQIRNRIIHTHTTKHWVESVDKIPYINIL